MLYALFSMRIRWFKVWLGWEDSNLRIQVPKTCVLPLDDTPIFQNTVKFQSSKFEIKVKAEVKVKLNRISSKP